MKITGQHWAMALSAAALVHAGVATAVLWQPPISGAKSVGMGGIKISLGPAGGAPGSIVSAVSEAPEAAMAAPIQEAAAPLPDPVTPEMAEPVEMETAEVTVQDKTPMPQPVMETSAIEVAEQTSAILSSAPGAGGNADTRTNPNAGSANDTSSGGTPGDTVDYVTLLQVWLEKHKKYPNQARMSRQEGIAILSFSLGRKGQILEFELKESTGYELLDTAVIRMVQKAEPFPPIPESLGRNRVDVTVPVYFSLD